MKTSSFRDPSARVFVRDGEVVRGLAGSYHPHYERLMQSGCYQRLVERGLLIPHEEIPLESCDQGQFSRLIKPKRVPFISYPYEWCFGQLRAAALVTLQVQKVAMRFDLSLKDASAFNIQFVEGKPVFIDTSSFEIFPAAKPWSAYRQFCGHFLGPLALASACDHAVQRLLRVHLDGLPLDLIARCLPWSACLRPSLLIHLLLHARSQNRHSSPQAFRKSARAGYSLESFQGLIESLKGAVEGCSPPGGPTIWGTYYAETNYSDFASESKKQIVDQFIREIKPTTVWDLGANTGCYSEIAGAAGARVVAFDADHNAIEALFQKTQRDRVPNLLPLLMDLTNPTPALGWAGEERFSLEQRGPADALLALALVHHLAIGNNLPLPMVAEWFARLGKWLIIEFVPKSDSQVKRLLACRKDLFPDYGREGFQSAFAKHFTISRRVAVQGSEREIYLMQSQG